MEIYIEFLTTQAKTLSFLAFVGKTYQEPLTAHCGDLVTALIQLLDGCPPENVQLRKDILVAARHFLSSEFRSCELIFLVDGSSSKETFFALKFLFHR